MRKKIFVFAGLLVVMAFCYGYYLYQKPARGVAGSEAELVLSAEELMAKKEIFKGLSNKIVEVAGEVTFIEEADETLILILNNGIKCELKGQKSDACRVGRNVTIKGIFSGFDELMNEISLSRCRIVE